MFYCEKCAAEHKWPYEFWMSMSRGPCEVCQKHAVCADYPVRKLREHEEKQS